MRGVKKKGEQFNNFEGRRKVGKFSIGECLESWLLLGMMS